MTVQRKRSRLPDMVGPSSRPLQPGRGEDLTSAKEKAGRQIRDYIRDNGAVE